MCQCNDCQCESREFDFTDAEASALAKDFGYLSIESISARLDALYAAHHAQGAAAELGESVAG